MQRKATLAWALVAWLAVLAAAPALALDVDSAKASGLVGERPDGYLGIVVADPSAEVKAMVDDVNGKRRAAYAEIARKNGTKVEAVAALAGAKLVDRTPPGQWVTDASGRWLKK